MNGKTIVILVMFNMSVSISVCIIIRFHHHAFTPFWHLFNYTKEVFRIQKDVFYSNSSRIRVLVAGGSANSVENFMCSTEKGLRSQSMDALHRETRTLVDAMQVWNYFNFDKTTSFYSRYICLFLYHCMLSWSLWSRLWHKTNRPTDIHKLIDSLWIHSTK